VPFDPVALQPYKPVEQRVEAVDHAPQLWLQSTFAEPISSPEDLARAHETQARGVLEKLGIDKEGSVSGFDARHRRAVEYVVENAEVGRAVDEIVVLVAAAQTGGGAAAVGSAEILIDLKNAVDASRELMTGDRYLGTLHLINTASSQLASRLHIPPGVPAVLNLTGAAATAYIYGFFFAP
jgi:hypothetical protein